MYLANILVDSGIKVLTRLFCPGLYDEDISKQITPSSSLPLNIVDADAVYWPTNTPNGDISSWRAHGAISVVEAAGDALVLDLGTSAPYGAFLEREYLGGVTRAEVQPGCVFGNLKGRSFFGNVSDNIYAPSIGTCTAAEYTAFVTDGKHAQGVAARVVAFAIEHALAEFTSRLRVRNAAACYWSLAKYRQDNINFSLQNAGVAGQWSSPMVVGAENDPTAVLWVGPAVHVRGMSLLSRIMDAGGPLYGQRSYLLEQFDPGRLLMVGTGILPRELPNVQANDLWIAIREAFMILEKFNHVTESFINSTFHALIHNLPVMDLATTRECEHPLYCSTTREYGDAVIPAADAARLQDAVDAHFGADLDVRLGLANTQPNFTRNIFAELGRDIVLSPPDNEDGFAPPINVQVTAHAACILGQNSAAHPRPIHNEVARQFSLTAPNAPMVHPNSAPRVRDFEGAWAALSSRALFRVFVYSAGPDANGNIPMTPGCVTVANANALNLAAFTPAGGDGEWQEYTQMPDANGVALLSNTMRAYVLRSWLPTRPSQYRNYVAPVGTLKRFDAPPLLVLRPSAIGRAPEWESNAPKCGTYLAEVPTDNTPLEFATFDGLRGSGWTADQNVAALVHATAYLWDAAHLASTQNDAYGRWVRQHRGAARLTRMPDEFLTFLGGARVRKFIEPAGGLWSLCYLQNVNSYDNISVADPLLQMLRSKATFASMLVKLRATIDMADSMLHVSNSRMAECNDPMCYEDELFDRIARGHVDKPLMWTAGEYLKAQSVVVGNIFANPHGVYLNEFDLVGVGTQRLREPRVRATFPRLLVQRCNWVRIQVMRTRTAASYLGVQPPTFMLEERGRAMLQSARRLTEWTDFSEEFKPGVMVDVQDEIWLAVLTTLLGDKYDPVTLSISAVGQVCEVLVSQLRVRECSFLHPLASRLILPQT